MEERRFDALVKALAVSAPRRTLLKAIGAAAVGGGIALRGGSATDARHQVKWCAPGFRPCRLGNQTACCNPGEYCCKSQDSGPTCASSKWTCRSGRQPSRQPVAASRSAGRR